MAATCGTEQENAMGLGLRTTGRAKAPLVAEIERELDEMDLASLAGERGVSAPQIGALRERHHALARLIAEGKKPGEAAVIMRYTAARVSILLSDPAFQELVEHYRSVVDGEFVDFQKKLAELGVDAAHLLQERLEDPEQANEFSNAALLQLVTISADRTGHGPSAKTEVNVKVGLADRLLAAKERHLALRDITPKGEENGDD